MGIWRLLKDTFDKWRADKAPRLAAALSYYTLFSIAPLLTIAIAIAGLMFGEEIAQSRVLASLQDLVGETGAQAIRTIIENTAEPSSGLVATGAGVALSLLGASNVFNQLKDALNTIWGVTPEGRGVRGTLRDRLLAFVMVLGIGFLLLLSLMVSTAIAALSRFLDPWLHDAASIWQRIELVVSFGIITLLFAAIYKLLPDTKIAWGDVWIGAVVTAVLFTLGKFAIGLYLTHVGIASMYGAAGSLVVILLWVYYSAQIFLFGAEFTYVYATRYGSLSARGEEAVARDPLTPASPS